MPTITPTVGKDLVDTLSQTLVKDYYAAIIEFICNSYDEDAEVVNLTYDSLEDKLIIEDDGQGMNKEGVENFYRLGDSTKLENPVSPKGRRRIGKFGIATVLLEYLGKTYALETWQDGKKITVNETFGKTEPLSVVESLDDIASHGTRITIRELNFDKTNFSLKRFLEKLQWEIPAVPDFNVYVNNEYVRKRGFVTYAAEYLVEEKIDGHLLHGIIYFKRLKSKQATMPGILLYVDNRSVGDPAEFRLIDIDERLEGRTLGIINADFLRDSITLDKSRFQETDPRFLQTKEAILRVLRSIDHDLDVGESVRAYYRKDIQYKKAISILESAENILNQKLSKDSDSSYYSLKLDFGERSGPIASLNKRESSIYINAENPMLVRASGRSSEALLQKMFLTFAIHALSNHEIRGHLDDLIEVDRMIIGGAKRIFGTYNPFSDILRKHHRGITTVPVDTIPFNRYRLYSTTEIADLSGRDRSTIRYLITSGVLKEKIIPSDAKEKRLPRYMRGDIVPVLKQIEGYKSAISIADSKYGTRHVILEEPKPSFFDKQLGEYASEFPGLINMGIDHPFYFVPNDKIKKFRAFIKKKGLVK